MKLAIRIVAGLLALAVAIGVGSSLSEVNSLFMGSAAHRSNILGDFTLAADGCRTVDMWGVVEPDDRDADPAWRGFSDFKRTFGGTPLRHPGLFDLVTDRRWYALRQVREGVCQRLQRR